MERPTPCVDDSHMTRDADHDGSVNSPQPDALPRPKRGAIPTPRKQRDEALPFVPEQPPANRPDREERKPDRPA